MTATFHHRPMLQVRVFLCYLLRHSHPFVRKDCNTSRGLENRHTAVHGPQSEGSCTSTSLNASTMLRPHRVRVNTHRRTHRLGEPIYARNGAHVVEAEHIVDVASALCPMKPPLRNPRSEARRRVIKRIRHGLR